MPVTDQELVDRFLERLDLVMAGAAQRPLGRGFFSVATDFYRLPAAGESVRCFAWEFFSFRFRFFVARVDENLIIATQPFILDDLFELAAADPAAQTAAATAGPAHLLVRVRPENWNRVLADYRLGWAESNRRSCLKNIGPLTGVARATNADGDQLLDNAKQMVGVQYFCPEGGHYETVPAQGNGPQWHSSVRCTIHGTAAEPRQATAPEKGSELDRLLSQFTGLTAALTFTEEGWRARMELQRKGSAK
jgi:hypothetical protein